MKISFCIPNYNYARYLGQTVKSALAQEGDVEVVVSDNKSTDESVAIVEQLADKRVRVSVNRANVGFAANLDRAARMAAGEWLVMLSSDDVARPGALETYRKIIGALPSRTFCVTSTMDVIDADDRITGRVGPDTELYYASDRDETLSELVGAPVYRVPARDLLRRCLLTMKTPFNFAATCYRRIDYQAVEGYGGGRMMNPDKWFHWRLLGTIDEAIFVDIPLFAYRWHAQNQTAQQSASGSLKHLVDEYASTLEIDATLLGKTGLTREDIVRAFVERDIVRHGLATLGRGDAERARRVLEFGRAAYPDMLRASGKASLLAALLRLDVLGQPVARVFYRVWTATSSRTVGP